MAERRRYEVVDGVRLPPTTPINQEACLGDTRFLAEVGRRMECVYHPSSRSGRGRQSGGHALPARTVWHTRPPSLRRAYQNP